MKTELSDMVSPFFLRQPLRPARGYEVPAAHDQTAMRRLPQQMVTSPIASRRNALPASVRKTFYEWKS
ncbi:MAG: hypothetical protein AAAB36_15075, partial [Ensifer adhaerens]